VLTTVQLWHTLRVQPELIEIACDTAPVRGYLHAAANDTGKSLVLTHGAGGNSNGPLLVALAQLFAESGVHVLRCDLPYRQLRPHGPPSPSSAARDQAGLRQAIEVLRQRFGGTVYLGGHSYGGRQASMLAATDSNVCAGLLLLSYPLHPPGRASQLRTAHFPTLQTPTLFVSGARDAFASPDELDAAVSLIPARTEVMSVPSAAHSLVTKSNQQGLPPAIRDAFLRFFVRAN